MGDDRSRSRSCSRSRSRSISQGSARLVRSRSYRSTSRESIERKRSRSRSRSISCHSGGRSRSSSCSSNKSHSPDLAHHEFLAANWQLVKDNPDDFDAWTALLVKVEQMGEIKPAREAFERFLAKYPYCYGYWRKYAEMERKMGNYERALEVWERSVSAIPLCIDLWIPFLTFFRELAINAEGGVSKIRELMERALLSAGLEYNSDRLWNEVVAFEEQQNCQQRIMEVYERLIGIPTALNVQQFERFQSFVMRHEPNEILSNEEYRDLFNKAKKTLDIGVDQMVTEERVILPATAEGEEVTYVKKKHIPEALKIMRDELLTRRRAVHLETAGQVMKRAPFEEKIKRPYFHVKPLDPSEFDNWRQYIDMEMDSGKESRVVVLFERCLIATALYDDFWIKYARWRWRKIGDEDGARAVFRRACDVHCKKKPLVHFAFSAFEEGLGNFSRAQSILTDLNRRVPGLALVQVRLRGLDRRRVIAEAKERGEDAAHIDFGFVLHNYEKMIAESSSTPKLASYYSIKLAQFHNLVRGNSVMAEKVLKEALRIDPSNYQLMCQLIDLAMQTKPIDEKAVIEAFDYCLQCHIPITEQLELSQRKLEFLEELSSDIMAIQDHLDAHNQLVHKSDMQLARKRLHLIEQSISERNRRVPEKRPRLSGQNLRNRSDRELARDRDGERDRDRERDRERSRERERGRDRERDRHSRRH